MQVVKTILADDHRIFVEGLKSVLHKRTEKKFDILGIAHNGLELIRMVKRHPVDLLILDLNLPEKDGLEAIDQIRRERKGLRILTLSMYNDPKIIKTAFKVGTDGYILKNKAVSELYNAIETILRGQTFLGEGVSLNGSNILKLNLQQKLHSFSFEDRFIKKHHLTKREMEILRLITQAFSNKEIAKQLYISDQTVGVHRKNIMRKLGVSNAAGLIKLAYDNCLV